MQKIIFGHLIFLVFLVFRNELNAQNSLFLSFPTLDTSQRNINAESLLREVNWEKVASFCDTTEGHYARKYASDLITTYNYTKQGNTANFKITIFKGKVLEYRSHVNGLFKTNYFNRDLWLQYVEADDKFKDSAWTLTKEEMSQQFDQVVQAYYTLIGFNSRDEYGWICEYAAAGIPPDKRLAVIELINYKRRDFLVKLLDHPNLQTKLYVADALIYLDMIGEIKSVEMVHFKGGKKHKKYLWKYTNQYKLSKQEWKKIKKIRDADYTIITCGNMGSYKQYKSTSAELLSQEAIRKIYTHYSTFKLLGYLF